MSKNDTAKYFLQKTGEFLERLRNLRHKKLIKIVTGGCRCGKSMIPEMFRDELPSEGIKKEQIIFLSHLPQRL
ncbi:hypothetical protein [Treponema parvum]|uniref:hypothetical protein n=1 Tax=Treponema parvum TaxID=138851 RepID=UPI001AEC10E3|nr:hypothetical protein [Treponema parvum]QTQ15718.1 hypothetical protein HXT04_02810 [Treponema parvum]